MHAVDEDAAGAAMVRNEPSQPPRDAPTTSTASVRRCFTLGGDPKPPKPLFEYVANGSPAITGRNVLNFHVGFDLGYDPTWTFDAATDTWQRSIGGTPQTVTGPGPHRPRQRRGAVHAVLRRGRGADHRRG